MTEYSFSAEREVYTFAYLFKTATDSLRRAEEQGEGSFYTIISTLVFSAFALEGYLNHLGEIVIPYWKEIDRISTRKKLNILMQQTKVRLNAGERPLQTIDELFRFRNFMAHGRTETVRGSGVVDNPDPMPKIHLIATEWEEFCNLEEAKRAVADVSDVIERLSKAAGQGERPLLIYGSGSYSLAENGGA